MQDLDLPTFNLSVLTKATRNFSSENKLGEGGFGPVYKVIKKMIFRISVILKNLLTIAEYLSGHTDRWERDSCEKAFKEICTRVG